MYPWKPNSAIGPEDEGASVHEMDGGAGGPAGKGGGTAVQTDRDARRQSTWTLAGCDPLSMRVCSSRLSQTATFLVVNPESYL